MYGCRKTHVMLTSHQINQIESVKFNTANVISASIPIYSPVLTQSKLISYDLVQLSQ